MHRHSTQSVRLIPLLGISLLVAQIGFAQDVSPVPSGLSASRAESLAMKWEAALNDGNVDEFQGIIDFQGMLSSEFADLKLDAATFDDMRGGFEAGLAEQLLVISNNGGLFRLLRLRQESGSHRGMYRVDSDAGINYYDVLFEHGSGGKPQITEIYVAATGETLAKTLRRMMLPILAENNKSLLSRLLTSESAWVEAMPRILDMQGEANQGNYVQAVAIFDAMPEVLKNEKVVILLGMQSLLQIDRDRYAAEIQRYAKLFPKDPSRPFIALDGYILSADYDRAFEMIDQMDKFAGGDPYLDLFRGNVSVLQGKLDQAKKYLKSAIETEPSRPDAYYQLMDLAFDEGDFAELVLELDAVEEHAGMDMSGIVAVEAYAAFIASPEGKAWTKKRGLLPEE